MSTENKNRDASGNSPGVHSVTVDVNRAGQRLDNFLTARLKGVPRSVIYRIIRTGQVRVNGGRRKAASRLNEGDLVRIPPVQIAGRDKVAVSARVIRQLNERIIHQDDEMLVINKPSGVAVHAGSGLSWGVIDAFRQERPGEYLELVHRLDRETSGCLVLARSGQALKHLSEQFRAGQVRKKYLCLLDGPMKEALVVIDAPLEKVQTGDRRLVQVIESGKPALTHFHLLRSFENCSYAEVELFTGRTHQIRAHARQMGVALAGDELYSDRHSHKAWRKYGLKRLFLHAHSLGITGPTGADMEFNAPLPERLRLVLDKLEDEPISYAR